jgi:hypothetical protein
MTPSRGADYFGDRKADSLELCRKREPYGESGKYKLVFSEPAKPINPVPFADPPDGSMQGPRYTAYSKLLKAAKISDLF